MSLTPAQHERLAFLCRITQKEILHLQGTDRRLFADLFTVEAAKQIETDPILAERLGWIDSAEAWPEIRKL